MAETCRNCARLQSDPSDAIGGYHCVIEGVAYRLYESLLDCKRCGYWFTTHVSKWERVKHWLRQRLKLRCFSTPHS